MVICDKSCVAHLSYSSFYIPCGDLKQCLAARAACQQPTSLPEIGLQLCGGMVDHGTKAVYAGAGQGTPNAFLHYVKYIIHHAGDQLTFLIRVHGNSLIEK